MSLFGQLNMTYVGNLTYDIRVSDIWGYAAPNGDEYALVGLNTGVSVVSLSDPANPTEVSFLPGANSNWRDIKTWDQYAYVTNETGNGLMVIDLTDPNNATSTDYEDLGNGDILTNLHNLYIDEFGYIYLAGGSNDVNSGGAIILDVFTDPANPAFVAYGNNVYSHDFYARGNILYASEIYEGTLTLYDVSDKNNIIQLGSEMTPFEFTHNAWPNDAGDVVFTTDEQANAPVAAYDVSDPSDIQLLDEFIPIETLGEGVIPHNVHVWNDWLIISYYTDGCILVDGSNPSNLIEVGNFDTFIPASSGFDGAWGAYPFLPSGLVLVSDIGNGLYVLEPNYVRACWLEGTVTDAVTMAPIDGVEVSITATQANGAATNVNGNYETGLATAGTYDVTFTAAGYSSLTVPATIVNGEVTILDVQLNPPNVAVVSGQVTDAVTGQAIPNAIILLEGTSGIFEGVADFGGNFSISAANDTYSVATGAWGYLHKGQTETVANGVGAFNVELTRGYQDDFFADFGWTVSGSAITGIWERGDPNGTTSGGELANPEDDVMGDLGSAAYVTGNDGGGVGADDVDDGTMILTSPTFGLNGYVAPELQYNLWFYNGGGQGEPDDELVVKIDNGVTTVVLETLTEGTNGWSSTASFILNDYIALTNNMRVIFETSDVPGNSHLVEAGVDAFKIIDTGSAAFAASVTSGCTPLIVNFTPLVPDATSWSWTFEDGTPATSTDENPSITFPNEGTFGITLSATTPSGVQEFNLEDYIVVNTTPEPDFNISIDNFTATFENTTSNATSFFWNFGDGATSTEESPTHTYAVNDDYIVSLTASNQCGSFTSSGVVPINAVGINDIDENISMKAFPNPFADAMTIGYQIENADDVVIRIFNVLGQVIEQVVISDSNGSLQLGSEYEAGIYLIRMESETKVSEVIKVIKN